jgi:hypothetical protein
MDCQYICLVFLFTMVCRAFPYRRKMLCVAGIREEQSLRNKYKLQVCNVQTIALLEPPLSVNRSDNTVPEIVMVCSTIHSHIHDLTQQTSSPTSVAICFS